MKNQKTPFPHAKPVQPLREEDAFMREHGSFASCTLCWIVEVISSAPGALMCVFQLGIQYDFKELSFAKTKSR